MIPLYKKKKMWQCLLQLLVVKVFFFLPLKAFQISLFPKELNAYLVKCKQMKQEAWSDMQCRWVCGTSKRQEVVVELLLQSKKTWKSTQEQSNTAEDKIVKWHKMMLQNALIDILTNLSVDQTCYFIHWFQHKVPLTEPTHPTDRRTDSRYSSSLPPQTWHLMLQCWAFLSVVPLLGPGSHDSSFCFSYGDSLLILSLSLSGCQLPLLLSPDYLCIASFDCAFLVVLP